MDESEVDEDFSDGARDPIVDGTSEVLTEVEDAYEVTLGACPLRVAVDAILVVKLQLGNTRVRGSP